MQEIQEKKQNKTCERISFWIVMKQKRIVWKAYNRHMIPNNEGENRKRVLVVSIFNSLKGP